MLVKICGITRTEDAVTAAEAGADCIGLNFWVGSNRALGIPQARAIAAAVPPRVRRVGVFVNADAETIRRTAAEVPLDAVQLHGDETPAFAAELADLDVWKAIGLKDEADLQRLDSYGRFRLLVDTPSARYGGSGRLGNWQLAQQAAARFPIILAGGLNPTNVAAAIAAVRPAGVDVASGVEWRRGVKDAAQVRAFIAAARRVEQSLPGQEHA